MKTFLLIAALTFSSMTFADSELDTYDAYEVCPQLRRMTQGYNVYQHLIEKCISIIEPNEFLPEAFDICTNLKHYITPFTIYDGYTVNECFDKIKNKNFSEGRLQMCKNLSSTRMQNGSYTRASHVIECLSK